MEYKNIKVDEISISIELKENASEDSDENEEYVIDLLEKNNIQEEFGVENPIDDLVYLQPSFLYADNITKEGINSFIKSYNKIKEIFKDAKISLHLDGFLSDENQNTFNEVDVTLKEFLALYPISKKLFYCNEDGVTEWCVAEDKKEAYQFMTEQWGKDTMHEYESEYLKDNPRENLDSFIEDFFKEENPESDFTFLCEDGRKTRKVNEWLEDVEIIPSYFACEEF